MVSVWLVFVAVDWHIVRAVHCTSMFKQAVVLRRIMAKVMSRFKAVMSVVQVLVPTIAVLFMVSMMKGFCVSMGTLVVYRLQFIVTVSIAAVHRTQVLYTWLNTTVVTVVVFTNQVLVVKEFCHRNIVRLLLEELGDGGVEEFCDRDIVFFQVFGHDSVQKLDDRHLIFI